MTCSIGKNTPKVSCLLTNFLPEDKSAFQTSFLVLASACTKLIFNSEGKKNPNVIHSYFSAAIGNIKIKHGYMPQTSKSIVYVTPIYNVYHWYIMICMCLLYHLTGFIWLRFSCNLTLHNYFYFNVLQSWDAALARTARAWANKCVFKSNTYLSKRYQCHPTFEFVGENIWIGSYQIFDVQTAVSTWYKNNIFYNFSLHTCIKNCDRYIQVRIIFSKMLWTVFV